MFSGEVKTLATRPGRQIVCLAESSQIEGEIFWNGEQQAFNLALAAAAAAAAAAATTAAAAAAATTAAAAAALSSVRLFSQDCCSGGNNRTVKTDLQAQLWLHTTKHCGATRKDGKQLLRGP